MTEHNGSTPVADSGPTTPPQAPSRPRPAAERRRSVAPAGQDDGGVRDGPARHAGRGRRDLEREGEVAADFLEVLLDIADLDGDIDVDVDGDRAAVAIVDSDEGRVPRRLVGPDGKVLDALQELTRLAVQSATGERSRLMLDVAGYRAERRAALVRIAEEAIAEVKASGARRRSSPCPPSSARWCMTRCSRRVCV